MINIALHIERLLQDNDCVMVPGLGGFVAQDCCARYVEEEEMFLPPYRSVSFNQKLTMNDGLLANDIAQYYNMSYREAVKAVEGKVAEIRQTIETRGEYNISGVGRLYADQAAAYAFEPLPCGISAPFMYGLDSIYASPIGQEEESRPRLTLTKKDRDTLTLKVSMNLVRYAAVVAVATVFFFICTAPLSTAISQERSEAGMFHQLWSMITEAIDTPSTNVAPVATETAAEKKVVHKTVQRVVRKTVVRTAATANPEVATAADSETPSTPESATAKPYTIVLASAITESNATTAVENLHQRGLSAAHMMKRGKMVRVTYGAYTTEDEARDVLRQLREENADFSEAWIYEIPE